MTTTSVKKAVVLLMSVSLLVVTCTSPPKTNTTRTEQAAAPGGCAPITFTINPKSDPPPWVPPADIPGGAQSATLQAASVFAWQEFIALNWPAVAQNQPGQPVKVNTRDQPDPNAIFGDPNYSGANAKGPLVWHTFRHKVEIFTSTGNPPGYVSDATKFFGYDAPPQYLYAGQQIPPFGQASSSTPWINLDEQSEIGLDTMYAGNAPTTPFPGQQILFLAKANRAEYTYVAVNQWWSPSVTGATYSQADAINNTSTYIGNFNNGNPGPSPTATPISQYIDPPPGSTTQPVPTPSPFPTPDQPQVNSLVSLPNNTIEVKSAWRQLNSDEINSNRFYTANVRFYNQSGTGPIGYVDAVWGMVALHIIQKTQSAPYFIYATFSQADNILDVNGNCVEDENGNLLSSPVPCGQKGSPSPTPSPTTPLDPNIVSQNATSANPATPQSVQQLSVQPTPSPSPTPPGKRIYYANEPTTALPKGLIAINRREHNIPQCVVDVNTAAHAAILDYGKQNNITNPVWQYYKLVNVQYQPYDKKPGETYTGAPGGPDPSTYYQANEVVESDYNLQVFSGHFQQSLDPPNDKVNVLKLITDFNDDGTPFRNTYYSNYTPGSGKAANMGGCMGCHANAQVFGADFSFILLGPPVTAPEVAAGPGNPSPQGVAKFRRLLLRK